MSISNVLEVLAIQEQKMFSNDANGKPGVYKLVCAIIHPLTVLSSPPIEFYRFTTTSTMPTYPEMFHIVWAL